MRAVRAAGWAALALAFAAAVVPQLPLHPGFLATNLDGSFAAVLHHAAAPPPAERPRLISTFGPLGYTHYSLFLPETYGRMLAVRAALAVVLCAALAWFGAAAWRSPWGGTVLLLGVALVLPVSSARDFLYPALVLLAELVPIRPPPAWIRVLLGAALGVLALSKVTLVTATVVAIGPVTLAALLARRVPYTALSALVATAVAWVLCGYGWADWVAYLEWSLRDITPGYSEAMQLRTGTALVLHAVGVSLALLAWASILAWRSRRPGWWAVPLGFAGVLLLQFKAGFVRADIHVFNTAAALFAQALLLAVLLGSRPRAFVLGGALVLALPGLLWWHAVAVVGPAPRGFAITSPGGVLDAFQSLPTAIRGDVFAATHARHVRDIRAMMTLPSFDGGVDLIGHWQSLLLARDAPYRPRPVFQGYMAYTPRLSRENAAFLAGPSAPRWLLFHPETIDDRLPAMDDAAAWRVMLSDYAPAGEAGRYALLERRPVPRPWRLVPLGGADLQSDKPIDVPPSDDGPIWARIVIDQSWRERLTTQLFAGPYVYVDFLLAGNKPWRARIVPAIAADGFLLSPVVTTVPGFLALNREGPRALPDQAVRQMRVHVDSAFGAPTSPRTVRVEFWRLELGS